MMVIEQGSKWNGAADQRNGHLRTAVDWYDWSTSAGVKVKLKQAKQLEKGTEARIRKSLDSDWSNPFFDFTEIL